MSKKKNRHEVTDLIKGEKYTYGGETSISETGTTTGGEGMLEKKGLMTLQGNFFTYLNETRR